MATMAGVIAIITAVSPVQRTGSQTPPGSHASTSPRCWRRLASLRQHRRGWAAGHCRCQKAFEHRMGPYVRKHIPIARLHRAKWHYRPPRWKRWKTRSAIAAVWGQDRRRRYCRRYFPVYELLFTLRRTQEAIGRYEGATGAAVAAAGLLRRHGRCRRRIPGAGKGLTRAPRPRSRFCEDFGLDNVPLSPLPCSRSIPRLFWRCKVTRRDHP